MSSQSQPPPSPPTRVTAALDSLALRLCSTTGKDRLPLICAGGLGAEMLWHSQAEARWLGTAPAQVRAAMRRAVVFWPGVFVATSAALWWAERRVGVVVVAAGGDNDDDDDDANDKGRRGRR
ncbi:hypothetical protein MN608_00841 [Microdochium nivale]|nr:hypothetical protein MN608_00841 [Microdochium nivale]